MKWMFNQQLMNEEEVTIPASDHGFLYGVGLFETFRVYEGVPFLFEEHLNRMQQGLEWIGIRFIINHQEMKDQLSRLLQANHLKNAYVRLTLSGGTALLGLPIEPYQHPNLLWQMKELPAFEENINSWKRAVFLKIKRNLPETEIRLKSLNFINHVLAKQEISHLEQTEGIFLTQEGYIAEGIVSNIFFIKQGKVYTPSLTTGILNGITRQHVIFLCQINQISIEEGLFRTEDLLTADEMFITNSIQEIVPVRFIQDKELKIGSETMTDQISRLYKHSIKETIAKEKEVDHFEA